jgi:hypothetical protein
LKACWSSFSSSSTFDCPKSSLSTSSGSCSICYWLDSVFPTPPSVSWLVMAGQWSGDWWTVCLTPSYPHCLKPGQVCWTQGVGYTEHHLIS